jgi:sialate O-acetylesterase
MKMTIADKTIPLAGAWPYRVEKVSGGSTSLGPNSYPTLLFNAMINPLIPYAFQGVIWYQGEANADRAYQYRKAFPLMITDWRKHWKTDFPFYFVQLASFSAGNGNSEKGSTWAELREAQAMTLALANTGMAVTTDIGDSKDIHPKDKQDVGKRLAAIALHNTYQKPVAFAGPAYKSMKIENNRIILDFSNLEGGLVVHGEPLKGFEIAGLARKFVPAVATIEGDHVVVSAEQITHPVAVRYGWMDDAGTDNLYNKAGFPAPPFRTDKWNGITEKQKFTIQ